jgi:hypothetical protein
MVKRKNKIYNAKCSICGKEFYVKPSHLKRGWGKYCSKKCQNKGQIKGKFLYCNQCGKKIWRTPRDLKHSKSGKIFCSKSCQTLWRNRLYSGSNHPFWTGGLDKYRRVLLEAKIPLICNKCGYNNEQVLVAHHKDRNRKNKSLKNLEWLCRNCHYLIHERGTV